MNYKKRFVNYLLIVLLISNCFANIELGQIKDTYNILKEEDKDCSPLIGTVLWHKNVLKNFYRFGNKDHEIIKLIKSLFNYIPETDSFDISEKLITFVGHYLAPEVIGSVVGILKNKNLDKAEKIDLIQKVITNIGLTICFLKENIEIDRRLPKNIIDFSNNIVETYENCKKIENGEPYAEFIPLGILETFLYRKANSKKDIQNYFIYLNFFVSNTKDNLEKELIKFDSITNIIKINNYFKNEQKLSQILQDKKQREPIIKFLREKFNFELKIEKVKKIEEISKDIFDKYSKEFLLNLKTSLKKILEELQQKTDLHIFNRNITEETWSENNKYEPTDKKQEIERVRILSNSFSDYFQYDLKTIYKILDSNKNNYIETLIFAAFKSNLPDIKKQCSQTKTDNPKIPAFTDCVETALLNLIRIALYDSETGNLKLDKFEIKEELNKFFETKFISSEDEHKAWANIIENQPLITYSNEKDGYKWEIEPDIKNLIILIKDLLDLQINFNEDLEQESSKENFNSKYFKILCEKLNLEITSLNDEELSEKTDYTNLDSYMKEEKEVTIGLKLKDIEFSDFKLYMHKDHGEISDSSNTIEEWGWHALNYGFENIDLATYLLISCCYDGTTYVKLSKEDITYFVEVNYKKVSAGNSNIKVNTQDGSWIKLINHLDEFYPNTESKSKFKLYCYNLDNLSDDDTLLNTIKHSNNLSENLTTPNIKKFALNLINPENFLPENKLDFYNNALNQMVIYMVIYLEKYSKDFQKIIVEEAIKAVKEVNAITPEKQEAIDQITLNLFENLEVLSEFISEDFKQYLFDNCLKKIEEKTKSFDIEGSNNLFLKLIDHEQMLDKAFEVTTNLLKNRYHLATNFLIALSNKNNIELDKKINTFLSEFAKEPKNYMNALSIFKELISKNKNIDKAFEFAIKLTNEKKLFEASDLFKSLINLNQKELNKKIDIFLDNPKLIPLKKFLYKN